MTKGRVGRAGFTTGDFVVALGLAAIVFALAYPALRARAFRVTVDDAVGTLETVRSGALRHRMARGAWPTAGEVGEIPIELVGEFPGNTTLMRDSYSLQWTVWETVSYTDSAVAFELAPDDAAPDEAVTERIPVFRRLGGVVVYSSDDALKAELLSRYGREVSFVRDSTWTLVVPEPARNP